MRSALKLSKFWPSSCHCMITQAEGAGIQQSSILERCRGYSNLPADYGKYYDKLDPPRRRVVQQVEQAETVETVDSSSNNKSESAQPTTHSDGGAKLQHQAASSVTAWMFPWEKRQMDGQSGPLRSWERLYWGVFVSAIAYFLFTRLSGKDPGVIIDPEEEARKEKLKLKAARLLMAGQVLSEEDEEQFEGLSPKEIQEYVTKAFGSKASSDPFEGMSPEEINELLATSGSR